MPESDIFHARSRRNRADLVQPIKWAEPGMGELMQLPKSQQQAYALRKLALELYRQKASGEEIKTRTSLTISQVGRLHSRAATVSPVTGQPVGFYACLPSRKAHQKPHKRVRPFNADLARSGRGQKSALSYFFEQYPDIERDLVSYLRTRRLCGAAPEPRVSAASAVSAFHKLCRDRQLDLQDPPQWPFNTSRLGENAVRAYYARWRANNLRLAVLNEQGDSALSETDIDRAVASHVSLKPVQLPPLYARVELDEVSLPVLAGVKVPTKDGVEVLIDATRFYGLLVVDHRLPLILAARLSTGLRYTTGDVLATLRQALFPPARLQFAHGGGEFQYLLDAGYPAEVLPGLRGNIWQELAWDADATHISATESGLIKNLLGCRVSGERIGSPTARQMVERLNGFLSKQCSLLASATGTGPQDVVRRNPEEAVAKYDIRVETLMLLLDIWARNWNATLNPTLGMSPLQAARQLMEKQEVFLNTFGTFDLTDKRHEFFPRFRRELRFSRKTHGVLVVNLYGAKYSSAELAGHALLANAPNKACTLFVNDEDARIGWVVPDAYPELRIEVHVQNRRLRTFPHPLLWRQVTCALESSMSRRSRAVTPNTMLGFSQLLGEMAQSGDRESRATVVSFLGEQSRLMFGGESTVFGPSALSGTQPPPAVLDVEEAEEAELDDEPTLSAQPRKKSSGRRRSPKTAPAEAPVVPAATVLPRVRGSDLGLGL